MGVGAATLAALEPMTCCSGRDKSAEHIDPVLAAVVEYNFRSEQALVPPGQLNSFEATVPARCVVLQHADELALSLDQERHLLGQSQQARIVSGVRVPTPTVKEFQSAHLLEVNKAVAGAVGTKDGLESTESPTSWHDAPYRKSSVSTEARIGSSNQSRRPRLGVRRATLGFALSARAVQGTMTPGFDVVPDPPVAWTASNTPTGFEQHESAQAKAAFSFGQAQLRRSETTPLGRQSSSGSGKGGDMHCDAEWSGMAKRIQHQWTDANAEKRRRVFESAKLEEKLANYFQQQLIKERTGEGVVSPQKRTIQCGCGKRAIVDKALEIRLAQQRLKAEGQAV